MIRLIYLKKREQESKQNTLTVQKSLTPKKKVNSRKTAPKNLEFFFLWKINATKMLCLCSLLLGICILTRALQSTQFQIPRGVPSALWRREILVSKIR